MLFPWNEEIRNIISLKYYTKSEAQKAENQVK